MDTLKIIEKLYQSWCHENALPNRSMDEMPRDRLNKQQEETLDWFIKLWDKVQDIEWEVRTKTRKLIADIEQLSNLTQGRPISVKITAADTSRPHENKEELQHKKESNP